MAGLEQLIVATNAHNREMTSGFTGNMVFDPDALATWLSLYAQDNKHLHLPLKSRDTGATFRVALLVYNETTGVFYAAVQPWDVAPSDEHIWRQMYLEATVVDGQTLIAVTPGIWPV